MARHLKTIRISDNNAPQICTFSSILCVTTQSSFVGRPLGLKIWQNLNKNPTKIGKMKIFVWFSTRFLKDFERSDHIISYDWVVTFTSRCDGWRPVRLAESYIFAVESAVFLYFQLFFLNFALFLTNLATTVSGYGWNLPIFLRIIGTGLEKIA